MKYRHSLFFGSYEEAAAAEEWIRACSLNVPKPIPDDHLSDNTDERPSFEYSFWTYTKLNNFWQRYILQEIKGIETYALNVEGS